MEMNTFNILVIVAGGLALLSFWKPAQPALGVAVLLIAIALLTKDK